MLEPAEPIETDRLLLRSYVADDFEAYYAIASRADVARYLYEEPRTEQEARDSLQRKMKQTRLEKEGDAIIRAVIRKDTAELIGDVMLMWTSESHKQGEVGYMFHPDHGGKGFATEAAREMLRLGFEELGLHRICGRMDGRNAKSAAVLERLGMRREAHLIENEYVKGEWSDEVIYAMLESEWRARRAP